GVGLWWLVGWLAPFHFPPLLAAVIATLVVAFLGAAIYRITIQPAAHASELIFLIITTGLYLGIEGLALVFWGTSSVSFSSIGAGSLALGAMHVRFQRLLVFVATLVLLFLIWLLLERTLLGKALRACAMNRMGSRLVGISPERAGLMAFAISAGMSAIAGVQFVPLFYSTYDIDMFIYL